MTSENTRVSTPVALTIAGSDSGGGAGIQADLKTFAALGVYGTSAITALTAQNTQGVQGVHPVPPEFVAAQIQSVTDDMPVRAAKTGMLADAGIIRAVAEALRDASWPLVVDPVMVATSGDRLLADDAVDALIEHLVPRAAILTPNRPEAAVLLGEPEAKTLAEARQQARRLCAMGATAVLVKGGHDDSAEAVDVYADAATVTELAAPRLDTPNTHGTGCTLAAAIAAYLALGESPLAACQRAKHYLHRALAGADHLQVGGGAGPVDHFYAHANRAQQPTGEPQ